MNKLEKICVFCGSNDGNDLTITHAAKELDEIYALLKKMEVFKRRDVPKWLNEERA